MIALKPNEIHIWFAFPDVIHDVALLTQYEQLLTQEELVKRQRFYFSEHRHQYLITRTLVRTTLSRYLNIQPENLRFTTNRYGRPEIMASQGVPLRFNLSNTNGLIMCGVALQDDIGVDTETLTREIATTDIAGRYFSPQEADDLRQMDEGMKRDRFFQYWTLKESYIKARGMGLSLPLDQFTFHLPIKGTSMGISFDPCLNDTPDQWQCWLLKPTPYHYAAISVRRATNSPSTLLMKEVLPLREELDFNCNTLFNNSNIPYEGYTSSP
jgi:4'-phosphopantetheinyl transferase